MPNPRRLVLPLAIALAVFLPGPARAADQAWSWPVVGPVIRGFEPPSGPYGPGHRGIDIATSLGTPVLAPASGLVLFAGKVGGERFLTIDHGGGLVSTYSWLSSLAVRKGDVVLEGAILALTGGGHPGAAVPNLHFGVKRDGVYIDPLTLLSPLSVAGLIHLAPLPPEGG